MINHILRKSKFWDIHQKTVFNKRQKKVISKMFEAGPAGFQGGISAKKYTSMTKCSKATATRDLTELCHHMVTLYHFLPLKYVDNYKTLSPLILQF